ncbi:peptide ABC transporter substrate-binding protein [Clostridium tyrobutyricum]|uniref:peptide ABC transporter substrate-binding protein n=1 Tax=Clostridium tyrobutyricum TaxID=1519 RepID=UPI001C381B91|nr:peptide ABC transporter substrate-binding protein [Clostridium tyrobutyricum]MBV4419904.1 peptide ABC transporter substrate-binding protein [Clostridium tyrobutyricum]
MKKIIFTISTVIIIVLIFLLVGGVSVKKKVKQVNSSNYENAIVYNITKSPKDLVMLDSYNIREKDILSNLFEGLVNMDEDGKIIPGLAEKWSTNKDKTEYTFTIRKGAKWSNGHTITADDFVDLFSNILNTKSDNLYVHQLNLIFGVQDYINNNSDFNNVAIKALNDRTLQFRLNYSSDYFLNIMAEPVYSLRKINDNLLNWKKNYSNILYSGSFKIDKILDTGSVVLKKNNNYWNKGNVKDSKVVITFFNSSESALAAFQNGDVNLFTNPPISEIKNIENTSIVPSYGGEELVFNRRKSSELDNGDFRKAIEFSIDKRNIVQNILSNQVNASSIYVPYSNGNILNQNYIKADELLPKVKEAKEFMDKSEYKYNGIPLKLIYVNTVENKKVCDSIGKNIEDALGIEVNCVGYNEDDFKQKVKGTDYDIAKMSYRGEYYYPLALLENWESSSKVNFVKYRNSQFDTKILQAIFEKDDSKRLTQLKQAEEMLLQDTALIPLHLDNTILCSKNYVKEIYVNKLGNVKLDRAYLSK